MHDQPSLDLVSLGRSYAAGDLSPTEMVHLAYERIAQRGDDAVWLHLIPRSTALAAAEALERRRGRGELLPLYGIPFAVKDNIDVAGLPTTAACPQFSSVAKESSPLVERLLAAGALLFGKTNLDQFATGLVGTRSPYGIPSSVFNADFIAGGSSSGSAVAVAAGLVSFALGSDTAGSGRVPAAFNNIIGWKPTRGLLSTRGLVPACRSLDCVSVFSLTAEDAHTVGQVLQGFDAADPYSRDSQGRERSWGAAFRFGVPAPHERQFFGDEAAAKLYEQAIAQLEGLGGCRVEIDFAPFRETAALLYEGPWVAERLLSVMPLLERHPEALLPVTAKIIGAASELSAVACFQAFYRLEELRRRTDTIWQGIDVLALPTTGTTYSKEQVRLDPVQLNSNLGYYTNFANLLDLAAIAVPAGFRGNGLPFGLSLLAPAFSDAALCALASRFHAATGGSMGATKRKVSTVNAEFQLAVVGAHLSGQPLNFQLSSRGARFLTKARTAADYRLYALAGTQPPKPGLVREPGFAGPGIELEIWSLHAAAFAAFVNEVPAPLAIGSATLDSGLSVKCFVCEPSALQGAEDITRFGGWRAYLEQRRV